MSATLHSGDFVVCTACKAQSPVLPRAIPGRADNPTLAWKVDHQEVYHPNQAWQFEVRPVHTPAVFVVMSPWGTAHGCGGAFSDRDNAERRARDLEERFGGTVQVLECPLDVAFGIRVVPCDPYTPAASAAA